MIKFDCKFYNCSKCKILKRLYCRNEKCTFYAKEIKKIKSRECEVKHQDIKTKDNFKYINYGCLEFSNEEIELLKSGKLKIF